MIRLVINNYDSGPGSLRQAISDASSSGDAIEFQSDFNIILETELAINKNLIINSQGKNITISGNKAGRVFNIESGVGVTINRIFITMGLSDFGGAIFTSGTLTITNSTLSDNAAIYGGAINNVGTLTITNSTLSGNTSQYGGAINNSGMLTITRTTLSTNSADFDGGAIENYGTVTMTNSTISNNTCEGYGGALDIWQGELNISFSTIAMNQGVVGGGIYRNSSTICKSKNSIIAENANSNYVGVGTISVSGVNFSTDNTCSGFIQVSTDALKLGPLALNSPGLTETHALLQGSAAIDTVTDYTDLDGNLVTTDQRGVPRPQRTAGDAGAYEYYSEPSRGILFEEGTGKGELGDIAKGRLVFPFRHQFNK